MDKLDQYEGTSQLDLKAKMKEVVNKVNEVIDKIDELEDNSDD